MRSHLYLAASSLLVVVAACGSDSSGPKIGPASQVSVTASPTATGIVRTSIGAFTVKVADANGNGVAGNVVNFFASGGGGVDFAPQTVGHLRRFRHRDDDGHAGHEDGHARSSWRTRPALPTAATVTVTATAGPLVTLVTTPKFMRFFSVGDTARITYVLEDEFANAVTGATLTFAVGDPTLVSVDPQGLVRALRPGGITTITASSGGRSDTVGVNVLGSGCVGVHRHRHAEHAWPSAPWSRCRMRTSA